MYAPGVPARQRRLANGGSRLAVLLRRVYLAVTVARRNATVTVSVVRHVGLDWKGGEGLWRLTATKDTLRVRLRMCHDGVACSGYRVLVACQPPDICVIGL